MLVPAPPVARRTSAVVNESGSTWTSAVAALVIVVVTAGRPPFPCLARPTQGYGPRRTFGVAL